jgi:hypothetical protein
MANMDTFKMKSYVLIKDFDWFGKVIPKGTIYIQKEHDIDSYRCISEGNHIPWMDLTFHTLRASWSKEYFVEINTLLSKETFCF